MIYLRTVIDLIPIKKNRINLGGFRATDVRNEVIANHYNISALDIVRLERIFENSARRLAMTRFLRSHDMMKETMQVARTEFQVLNLVEAIGYDRQLIFGMQIFQHLNRIRHQVVLLRAVCKILYGKLFTEVRIVRRKMREYLFKSFGANVLLITPVAIV